MRNYSLIAAALIGCSSVQEPVPETPIEPRTPVIDVEGDSFQVEISQSYSQSNKPEPTLEEKAERLMNYVSKGAEVKFSCKDIDFNISKGTSDISEDNNIIQYVVLSITISRNDNSLNENIWSNSLHPYLSPHFAFIRNNQGSQVFNESFPLWMRKEMPPEISSLNKIAINAGYDVIEKKEPKFPESVEYIFNEFMSH